MMWDGMGHGFGWGIGMLGVALFWLLFAAALVWIVRVVWDRRAVREGPGAPGARPESPLEILQRRYARGEIDRAEFEEKRKDLS
jgi:putative membrane protein